MWIEEWRLKNDVSREVLARLAKCSSGLIGILEDQNRAVTHPNIANRIAAVAGATEEQRDSIVPRGYRGTLGPVPTYRARRPGRLSRRAPNGCAVVCLDRKGNELGRYASYVEAGNAHGCSSTYVRYRCDRVESKNGQFRNGCTFRHAAEWDAMTPAARMEDMAKGADGIRRIRAVVALLRGGIEVGRYPSMAEAARANECSINKVDDRCKRRHWPGHEFWYGGCTFRFADEWDAMTAEERMEDVSGELNGAPRVRTVVALLRGGIEAGRYASAEEAALEKGCSNNHVLYRCKRACVSKDEFRYCGCTFRYADEWDAMSAEEREKDMGRGAATCYREGA